MNMTTAAEIQMSIAELAPRLAAMTAELERQLIGPLVHRTLFELFSREVCARRARKIRRRGDDVRSAQPTANGKARYRWGKRFPEVHWSSAT